VFVGLMFSLNLTCNLNNKYNKYDYALNSFKLISKIRNNMTLSIVTVQELFQAEGKNKH
jgi:hypothetical protein